MCRDCWSAGGAEPSDAIDWTRNSVQAGTSSVKFAGDDDLDAFGFEEVRQATFARTSPHTVGLLKRYWPV